MYNERHTGNRVPVTEQPESLLAQNVIFHYEFKKKKKNRKQRKRETERQRIEKERDREREKKKSIRDNTSMNYIKVIRKRNLMDMALQ